MIEVTLSATVAAEFESGVIARSAMKNLFSVCCLDTALRGGLYRYREHSRLIVHPNGSGEINRSVGVGIERLPRTDISATHPAIKGVHADYFGRLYPNEALAILNPYLMLWEYVCVISSHRREYMLGTEADIYLLKQRPYPGLDELDDPVRLGSTAVNVAMSQLFSSPMLTAWWWSDDSGHVYFTRMNECRSL